VKLAVGPDRQFVLPDNPLRLHVRGQLAAEVSDQPFFGVLPYYRQQHDRLAPPLVGHERSGIATTPLASAAPRPRSG
jgi:hypothetical protein